VSASTLQKNYQIKPRTLQDFSNFRVDEAASASEACIFSVKKNICLLLSTVYINYFSKDNCTKNRPYQEISVH
jgi:hypothetical protein